MHDRFIGRSVYLCLIVSFLLVSRDTLNKRRSLISNQPVRAVYLVAWCGLCRETDTEKKEIGWSLYYNFIFVLRPSICDYRGLNQT